jgi:hypothetical protein
MTSIVQNMIGSVLVSRTVGVPDYNVARFGNTTSIERLPTEPIGTCTLRLQNAVRGSRFVAERSANDSLATPNGNAEGVIPAGAGTVTDLDVTLDYYAVGSPNNNLRITLRNASGTPAYKEFVTQITAQAGVVLAYCLQQSDEE